jgi:hypothetical protein
VARQVGFDKPDLFHRRKADSQQADETRARRQVTMMFMARV